MDEWKQDKSTAEGRRNEEGEELQRLPTKSQHNYRARRPKMNRNREDDIVFVIDEDSTIGATPQDTTARSSSTTEWVWITRS